MGQQPSKDESLYQQVSYGNVEGIKDLHRKGAGLEWIDKEAKTPLIVACMNPGLLNVASTLIELGANLNAYRPGRQGGTPLHHAAKRGLEHTVRLLLSRGANALVMNDDCQTPLDVARAKGFANVVRAIEGHICLFSGWLREFYGPGFLGSLAPQLVSRKVWVVVLPCGARNPTKPFKLELAVYTGLQDAKPRSVTALWKANLEEPNFKLPDPVVIIVDNSNSNLLTLKRFRQCTFFDNLILVCRSLVSRRRRRRRKIDTCHEARFKGRVIRQTRIKLGPSTGNDKEQLQLFCSACKGIPQGTHPAFLQPSSSPVAPATAPPASEDLELAMAINASIQSVVEEKAPHSMAQPSCAANASSSCSIQPIQNGSYPLADTSAAYIEGTEHGNGRGANVAERIQVHNNPANNETSTATSFPSAPPFSHEVMDDGAVHYPSVDYTPVNMSTLGSENSPDGGDMKKGDNGSSSCVICLDAPVEGACIPCGHMAGCMSCLSEIKAKKWGCPVCRSNIDQIIRLYAV